MDVMLDQKMRPYLIEVNHSPSFTCDTPFDLKIKSTLVRSGVSGLILPFKLNGTVSAQGHPLHTIM